MVKEYRISKKQKRGAKDMNFDSSFCIVPVMGGFAYYEYSSLGINVLQSVPELEIAISSVLFST